MLDKELIEKIRQLKRDRGMTLHELAKKIDVSISTLERWLKTGRINRIYADMVKERLNIN
jgi:transcriptional regulator with XRE-family HTH domain